MNPSTPTSLQSKTKHIKSKLQQLTSTVTTKKDDNTQLLRIQFISLLDDTIDRLEELGKGGQGGNGGMGLSRFKGTNGPSNAGDQFKERYFQTQKERIQLEKKITELLERQIREQQHALKLQRAESESLKLKSKLQTSIKELTTKIQKLHSDLHYSNTKIKDQDKQLHRLITLNHKLNEQKDLLTQQRFRAQKRMNELLEKYEGDQMLLQTRNSKSQRFNIKNTEGIRTIRTLTNMSLQHKPQQKYFLLELPAKLQVLRIVYGIRIGILNVNREITYLSELFMYEKDPMRLDLEGDCLVVEYKKRKERMLLDKYRLLKPQVVVLLYGKGDSVMVDQTKEVR